MAGVIASGIIRVWGSTLRSRMTDVHYVAQARSFSPQLIFTFWHGRMLSIAYYYRNRNVALLASEHRDGEIMGQTVRRLGYNHTRGSSTRGGTRAIRDLVRRLRDGHDVAITVDGPKGPRFVFKPGVMEIAKLSGSAVIPVSVSAKRRVELSSWDKFQLPVPFTSIHVRFGRPVIVPRDADPDAIEHKRLEIEADLRRMTESDDAAWHRT